jgi:hypothetical protein
MINMLDHSLNYSCISSFDEGMRVDVGRALSLVNCQAKGISSISTSGDLHCHRTQLAGVRVPTINKN